MNRKNGSHSIDFVFVLSLFCVFAACVLLSLMLGTKIYTAMSADAAQSHYRRTAVSYITEKLRHCDTADAAQVSELQGEPALILTETYGDVEYETTIYVWDGWLRELFCQKGLEFDGSAGSKIIEANSVEFSLLGDNLIQIRYTDPQGNQSSGLVSLRSGRAAA